MSWQLLALISVVTLSISSLFGRVLMRSDKSDPVGYGILFQFGLGFFALVFTLIFGHFSLPSGTDTLIRFAVSSVLWTFTTIFSFSAIKRLGAAESNILFSASSLLSILLGVLFLNENLSTQMVIGTLLILAAIWVVTADKVAFTSGRGIVFALLAAAFSGIAVVNDAFIIKDYDVFSFLVIGATLPGLLMLAAFPSRLKQTILNVNRAFIVKMAGLCFLYAIQGITFYSAFKHGAQMSQLSPITKSSVVLTVILAAIFISERQNLPRKLLASAIMLAGVILLG